MRERHEAAAPWFFCVTSSVGRNIACPIPQTPERCTPSCQSDGRGDKQFGGKCLLLLWAGTGRLGGPGRAQILYDGALSGTGLVGSPDCQDYPQVVVEDKDSVIVHANISGDMFLKKLKHFSTLTWASASQRANGIQHVLCHAKTVQKHYASLWQNRVRWGKTKFITPPERPCAPTLVTRLNLCGQQDSLYASQNNPNNDAHS